VEDVERIVATYGERSFQDKYSCVATLGAVKENNYNLNIPRYVDTVEEDDPVDIEATSRELRQLEAAMAETDKVINDYCQQLRIPTPF